MKLTTKVETKDTLMKCVNVEHASFRMSSHKLLRLIQHKSLI